MLARARSQGTLPDTEWWWSRAERRAQARYPSLLLLLLLLLLLGGGGDRPQVCLWEWHSSSCCQLCGHLLLLVTDRSRGCPLCQPPRLGGARVRGDLPWML
jgi:hypothetical protein